MAIGIIGFDAEGQPMYGELAPGMNQAMPPGSPQARPVNPPQPPAATQTNNTGLSFPSYTANPAYTYRDYVDKGIYNVQNGYQTNVRPQTQSTLGAIQQGLQWQGGALETLGYGGQQYRNEIDAITANQRANTAGANARGSQLVNDMGQAYGALNAFDAANYGNYSSNLNSIYNDLSSHQFSGAYQPIGYDQEGLAAQRQALSNFSSIYGGGLDYTAAQYASNPADIARQMASYNDMTAVGNGSLDYQAQLARAAQAEVVKAALYQYQSNPHDVRQQQDAINKLKGAISGGEWYNSMTDARDKYKALTTPEITDQERLIMEQFRQQNEGNMRANREALSADLGARGIRSGASEQVGLGMYNQQVADDRVMAELGAGANAIARSMNALEGYANTSAAGRQAELQAMGMYSDAAGNLRAANDAVGLANTNWKNQNSMFNAAEQNQTNRLNAQLQTDVSKFNAQEMNIAAANNQATRLAGKSNAMYQSNQIRSANDAVGMFNTQQTNVAYANNQATRLAGAQGYSTAATNLRNSNETINMFNKDQEMVQQRHMDNTYLSKVGAQTGIQNNLFSAGQATSASIGGRVEDYTKTGLTENTAAWNRGTTDTGIAANGASAKYGTYQDFAGMGFNYGGNIAQGGLNSHAAVMNDQSALQSGVFGGLGYYGDASKMIAGQQDAQAAIRAAEMAENPGLLGYGGFLGTGLGAKKGTTFLGLGG